MQLISPGYRSAVVRGAGHDDPAIRRGVCLPVRLNTSGHRLPVRLDKDYCHTGRYKNVLLLNMLHCHLIMLARILTILNGQYNANVINYKD